MHKMRPLLVNTIIAARGGVALQAQRRYEKRKKIYEGKYEKNKSQIRRIEMLRIITIVLLIAITIVGYIKDNYTVIYGAIIIGIIAFAILIVISNRLKSWSKKLKGLTNVYLMAENRVLGKWHDFENDGSEYIDKDHRYTWDLDIFGKASLFQLLNISTFKESKDNLAFILRDDANFTIEDINRRQEAIKELAKASWFREKLQAIDNRSDSVSKEMKNLISWLNQGDDIYNKFGIKILVNIMAILILGGIVYGIINKVLFVPLALILINIIILGIGYRKRDNILRSISSYNNNIKIYKDLLIHIEKHNYKSTYLKNLKKDLMTNDRYASTYINRLETLTSSISNRENAYFLIINICLLWDIRSMIKINSWKDEIKQDFNRWIEVIGEFTNLSAMGFMQYENPEWCMPKITESKELIKGRDVAHPLINKGRVGNDFNMEDPTKVMLITGSNMAGKSTFLRSVSINMVLGNIGCCVCAKEMMYRKLPIYTCMRVSDNLERNISSFFYELLRIKNMNEVAQKEKIFFVLDEIFKGTNSYDRHYGAKTIIKHFIDYGSLGMVSTHDLELGELENELNNGLKNYSFAEDYLDNEIVFDYKLRNGISKTRNARKLMEMLGLINK